MNSEEENLVKTLQARTQCGLMDCHKALQTCNNDLLLAQGYLLFKGCAISVRPRAGESPEQAYEAWLMSQAKAFKNSHETTSETHRRPTQP